MGTFKVSDMTDTLRDVEQSQTDDAHRGAERHERLGSHPAGVTHPTARRKELPSMPLKINRMKVDPDLATQWLGYNTHNRNHRGMVVAAYADAMKNGDWRTDIDPIAFAGTLNGRGKNAPVLLNGQHRLHALVSADITLEFLVIEGLQLDDQVEMDAGVKRQLADQLRLRGVQQATDVAAVLRLVYAYEQDLLKARSTIGYSTLLRYLEKHPELPDSITQARKLYMAIGGRLSVFGAAHYIISQVDDPSVEEDLQEFFDVLASGESLPPGSPVLALRNQILALSGFTGPKRRGQNAGQVPLMAIFFKAWNAWRDGATMQTLAWRGGGKHPESFPIPA